MALQGMKGIDAGRTPLMRACGHRPMLLIPGSTAQRMASRLHTAGTSAAMYWGTGMFGAALLGQEAVATANILQNDLGGGWWQGVLNIAFAGK